MRNCCIFAGLVVAWFLACGSASAAGDEMLAGLNGDVIARIHFAGTSRVAAESAGTKLNEFAELPETAALRKKTIGMLSIAPFRLQPFKAAKGDTNEFSKLLQPLLDDWMSEESYVEVRGDNNAFPEVLIAVRLDRARAKAWQDTLSKVVSDWTGMRVKSIKEDGYSGWELRKKSAPSVVRYLRAGDWVLFGWGMDNLRSEPEFLQNIKASKRPGADFKEGWLDAAVDMAALMKWHQFDFGFPLPQSLPKVHLNVVTRKEFVRPKVVMEFPQPLDLKLDPWNIPTDVIHNPLASFTVVRGIAPWLSQFEIIKNAQLPTVPNQLIFWSMARMIYENTVMAPMPGAGSYLDRVEPRLKNSIESYLKENRITNTVIWSNHVMTVRGIPFVTPTLRAVREGNGEFLRLEEFPPPRILTNEPPFPNQLLQTIMSQPKLVAYSWEYTPERAPQWLSLNMINLMARQKPFPVANTFAQEWIHAAQSKLGNCATEVTLTGPNELTLVRNSAIGFNALEITALEYWLDAPGFPWTTDYPKIHPPPKWLKGKRTQ